MARRSPARLVVALSVALVLAIFLVYTALARNSTPQLKPSRLAGHSGTVAVTGVVVGPVRGDAHGSGLRFALRDIGATRGATTVPVVFKGTVPDLFRRGRHVVAGGTYANGVVRANELVTKCPSKYAASKST